MHRLLTRGCVEQADLRARADGGRENAVTADARRVLRGGSWDHDRGLARAPCLGRLAPGNRNDDVGVRLARLSPIPKRIPGVSLADSLNPRLPSATPPAFSATAAAAFTPLKLQQDHLDPSRPASA
jgi:hypothetical protein